ncbi:hypothetical protein [Cystobacter ferrugineus]|uniref:hypothetical protein n=1 Tax=Cystobacter ferrugineus TaxID=83449 RepID=UPI001C9DFC97|nr:hypothetical protein [Cystobacter ferrugineus]
MLLGTGGLRKLRAKSRTEFDECWKVLNEGLEDRIGHTDVIDGKKEGELAWLAMEQRLSSPGKDFSILETGGASVQFAMSPSSDDITSDDAVGIHSIRNELDAQAKDSCGLDGNTPGNFESCRDAVERLLTKSKFLEDVKEMKRKWPEVDERPVYGAGEGWMRFDKEKDKHEVPRADLENLGKDQCARASSTSPCYGLAYTSALLRVMNITTLHLVKPYSSWTLGAAVHEDYFPACHVSGR